MRNLPPLLLLLAGCDAPPFEPVCPSDRVAPETGFTTGAPDEPVTDGVTLTGYTLTGDDLAVHRVVVAGQTATPETYNYGTWSVELTFDVLLAAIPEGGSDAEVEAVATDTCGLQTADPALLSIPVDAGGDDTGS